MAPRDGVDFNSHAHVERDRGRSVSTRNQRDFNSHAHVERDVKKMDYDGRQYIFQLTRSRGA